LERSYLRGILSQCLSLIIGIGESFCGTVSSEVIPALVKLTSRFYTTYRLLPVVKESVVVIASPGLGNFYDETDPGFEKPENRSKMTLIRQGRRDALFLDAIFKVYDETTRIITQLNVCVRNFQYEIQR
jgi:hypothetical protein